MLSSVYLTNRGSLVCDEVAAPVLAPPADLEVTSFKIDSEEYVVLAFNAPTKQENVEGPKRLTASERAVMALVLQGRTNAEIARARGTSASTIANQVSMLYRKLGVSSRRELYARRRA
jgi:DNA-binding NarL/FixJ family response regulator